jgi:signal transduction histidine kinase
LIILERNLPPVFVDAGSVSEVIYILLDNAAKYSAKQSKIRITARGSENETIEVAVEDQRRSITEEMREKVFDKFFRAGENDIHMTGSGLGLAIARRIIESGRG